MESMEAAFSRKRSREEMMPRGVKSGARKVMAMGKTMTRSWCTTKTLTVLLLLSSQWSGSSALMSDALYRGGLFPKVRSPPRSSTTTTTIPRRMVLTTPESIIEQASTQNLLDYLIDESVRTSARGPIMMQFDPSSGWIWKRWRGTIFSETWDVCVKSMLYATAILVIFKQFPGLKEHISGFNVLWGQLLSVTTFTLTFFVNQSYALWRKCYELSRRLQGRLHDVGMTLAIHAERKVPSGPNEPSTYTPASRQILELVSRYVRLFNVLTYASFTRSHRPILTPRGMRRLVERGLMTVQEREVLVDAEIPATQRHNAVLLWITRVFVEGWRAGHFIGGSGFENQILEKIHVCRAQYGAIGDELAGRMPLAYAHIVQILVDCVLWFYPFMAISSQMSDGLVVLGTGLLTICYQGLFDLAKQFLDPYDNESYGKGEDPLVVDTLIAETNSGSVRWMNSLNEFPVSPQRIKDGELSDYLLPVRGYSVEELLEMEEERKQRERDLQKRREREERERRKMEEKAAQLRQAAQAMIPALLTKSPTFESPTRISLERVNGAAGVVLPTATRAPVTFGLTETVSDVVGNLNALAGGIPLQLLPLGAAPAREEDNIVLEQRNREAREGNRQPISSEDYDDGNEDDSLSNDDIDDKGKVTRETEDFQNDEGLEVLEDLGADNDYVHTFNSFDSYKDLPWFEEVGADGSEIRLSQLLADEEWEEEKEAELEKQQPIRTFEEYSKRVEELRDATSSELAETEAILSAFPSAQSEDVISKGSKDKDLYDQTKLDGISQLWGSPPGEISELPSYSEPTVSGETDFRGIAKFLGEPASLSATTSKDREYDQYENESSASFSSIRSLWGGFDEDGDDSDNAASSVRERDDADASWRPFPVSSTDGSELRLSQILADEVWLEEANEEELEATVSFEEYEQQIADILEAEKEEQLETEAILNAPSFAEFVGTSDDDETQKSLKANNATFEDDLSVFEMDVGQELDATGFDSASLTAAEDGGVVDGEVELDEEIQARAADKSSVDDSSSHLPGDQIGSDESELEDDTPAMGENSLDSKS